MSSHPQRLAAVLIAGVLATAASFALAGPASAAVPEGFSNPAQVNITHALLVLGGIPLALFVIITALVYAPSLARGERLQPGATHTVENQWLGGPRKTTSELAGPDSESSQAGGSSARW